VKKWWGQKHCTYKAQYTGFQDTTDRSIKHLITKIEVGIN
jgi:hypothetical protein